MGLLDVEALPSSRLRRDLDGLGGRVVGGQTPELGRGHGRPHASGHGRGDGGPRRSGQKPNQEAPSDGSKSDSRRKRTAPDARKCSVVAEPSTDLGSLPQTRATSTSTAPLSLSCRLFRPEAAVTAGAIRRSAAAAAGKGVRKPLAASRVHRPPRPRRPGRAAPRVARGPRLLRLHRRAPPAGTSPAFVAWCDERGITRPEELSRLVVDLYQRHVARLLEAGRRPARAPRPAGQAHRRRRSSASGSRRERLVLVNPAADIEMPKHGVRLPQAILTVEEVERVLAVPDVTTPLGLRDRAIIEVFYSTGIRSGRARRTSSSRDLDLARGIARGAPGQGQEGPLRADRRAGAWPGSPRTCARSGRCSRRLDDDGRALPLLRRRGARRRPPSRPCSALHPRRPTSASRAPATSSATPWRP